jgi:hypothetical protein
MDNIVDFERHSCNSTTLAPTLRPAMDAPVIARQVQIERQMHCQPNGKRAQRRPESRREPDQRQRDLRLMRD